MRVVLKNGATSTGSGDAVVISTGDKPSVTPLGRYYEVTKVCQLRV